MFILDYYSGGVQVFLDLSNESAYESLYLTMQRTLWRLLLRFGAT